MLRILYTKQPALCYNTCVKTIAQRKRSRSGQAMVEYVLVFVALVAASLAFVGFFAAERRSAARSVGLVASEYP